LAHRRELVTAGDDPRVLDVREWWVAVHELPRGRAERPHVDLERVVKATMMRTSVVKGGIKKKERGLTSAFLEPVGMERSEEQRVNKGKDGRLGKVTMRTCQ
jgi:hypothetical protein